MEEERKDVEESLFNQMAETRQLDQLFNTTADSVVANANEVALLNPATADVFGSNIALEVRKGDTIRFSVVPGCDEYQFMYPQKKCLSPPKPGQLLSFKDSHFFFCLTPP